MGPELNPAAALTAFLIILPSELPDKTVFACLAFAVVFVAEFGDLTQILTVSLAARYGDPLAVGIGSTLALWVAAGGAIVGGRGLLKIIPMAWLTRGAAVVMLALAGASI